MRLLRRGPASLMSVAIALCLSAIVATAVSAGGESKTYSSPASEGGSKEVSEPAAQTVPARAAASSLTCSAGHEPFENPVMHVGLCVPAGWGFTDFTAPSPLKQLRTELLDNLHLASPGAFPWKIGRQPFDAIVDAGIVVMELNVLERDATWSTECVPKVLRAGYATCVQTYDTLGLPAATGPITAQKVIVPLATTPSIADPLFDATGSSLLVVIRHRTDDIVGGEQAWRIVESIRAR